MSSLPVSARTFLRLSAWFGAAAVILGAFGAHSLRSHFEQLQLDIPTLLHTYETGVQYHFYHTLGLALVGLLLLHLPDNKWLVRAGWCFLTGLICFSGSLYLLATQSLLPFPVRWAGPVTPLGGLFFIAGWAFVGIALNRRKF